MRFVAAEPTRLPSRNTCNAAVSRDIGQGALNLENPWFVPVPFRGHRAWRSVEWRLGGPARLHLWDGL